MGRSISIACANDVGDGNSNHQHANDVGLHMANPNWSGGSTWNLMGNEGEIAFSPGNWGKCLFSGLAAVRTMDDVIRG